MQDRLYNKALLYVSANNRQIELSGFILGDIDALKEFVREM